MVRVVHVYPVVQLDSTLKAAIIAYFLGSFP